MRFTVLVAALAMMFAAFGWVAESHSMQVHVKSDSGGMTDSDGDGVVDDRDACPGTPPGAKVDEKGCPSPMCITLNIRFDFDKAVVKPEYHEELKAAADFIQQYAHGKRAVIEGYTDSVGPALYNKWLSEARAVAVDIYLEDKLGIERGRLTPVGYGESKPIADNSTEEGREKNRRVILRICE